ncbi:response regulator transcription factor [Actinocorallia lasiicapitis]
MSIAPVAVRPGSAEIRLLVAGQDPVQRLGLRSVFERQPAVQVIAEAASPRQVIDQTLQARPQALAIGVPVLTEESLRFLRVVAGLTRVIVLTHSTDTTLIKRMLDSGVAGCLIHGRFAVVDLVRLVMGTGRADHSTLRPFLETPISDAMVADGSGSLRRHLSDREVQVMDRIADAMNNAEIARLLKVSEKTVKNHVNHIFAKLGVTNRAQAIVLWLRAGDPGPRPEPPRRSAKTAWADAAAG